MGLLFGGRQKSPRRRGLIGSLFGMPNNNAPRRRGLFRGNSILGAVALGALGYAANRYLNGRNSNSGFGGSGGNNSAGGGGVEWGNNSDSKGFDQNGQSWYIS